MFEVFLDSGVGLLNISIYYSRFFRQFIGVPVLKQQLKIDCKMNSNKFDNRNI